MYDLPPATLELDQFFEASHLLGMVDQFIAEQPTMEAIDFRLVGTTSNGWRTESHTLGSVSYRRSGDVALQGRLGCTTDTNEDGVEALREAMVSMILENIEGPNRDEADSRQEWMTLRGAV